MNVTRFLVIVCILVAVCFAIIGAYKFGFHTGICAGNFVLLSVGMPDEAVVAYSAFAIELEGDMRDARIKYKWNKIFNKEISEPKEVGP